MRMENFHSSTFYACTPDCNSCFRIPALRYAKEMKFFLALENFSERLFCVPYAMSLVKSGEIMKKNGSVKTLFCYPFAKFLHCFLGNVVLVFITVFPCWKCQVQKSSFLCASQKVANLLEKCSSWIYGTKKALDYFPRFHEEQRFQQIAEKKL